MKNFILKNKKIFTFLENISLLKNFLTLKFNYITHFKVFRTIFFVFLLLDTFLTLPIASILWSPQAYTADNSILGFEGIYKFLNLLNNTDFENLYIYILAGKIIFLILGILNIIPFISTLGIYFCLMNLDNKAWLTMNGGHNVIHVIFIYLILMHLGAKCNKIPTSLKELSFLKLLGNVIANLAFMSARFQLIVIYLVACLTKLQSNLWRDGVALYYVLKTPEFTHPWAEKLFLSNDIFIMMGTYGTLLFQLSFPWLIWNNYLRRFILFLGIIIHLQIAFVMGLFDFGIIILIMYILFLNKEEVYRFGNKLFPFDNLIIGFDHNCRICMRFSRLLKFLDIKDRLVIDSANNPRHEIIKSISPKVRLDKIASVRNSDNHIFLGFETIYEAMRRIPLLVPLSWILYIMKFTIGNSIYILISQKWRKKLGCNDNNECGL